MSWQKAFRVLIRVIFIFAYIAFLAASIRHVATFFHNFESDASDWMNPYTLAVSIDLTALVLTIGVMFFRANMPWYAQTLTWLFILALTAFSWFVNWEYAMTYQGNALHVNDTLRMLNPILASSFAFLNLAYSVVAEFFSTKNETAAELAAKVDELEQLEEQQRRLAAYKERTKRPSIIQRVKNTALEARAAVNEVLATEETEASVSPVASPQEPEQETTEETEQEIAGETTELEQEPETDLFVSLPVSFQVPEVELENETDTKPARNSDDIHLVVEELPVVSSPVSRNNHIPNTEAVKLMRRLIRRNQSVEPTELAEKAGVSIQYARHIKKQIINESA